MPSVESLVTAIDIAHVCHPSTQGGQQVTTSERWHLAESRMDPAGYLDWLGGGAAHICSTFGCACCLVFRFTYRQQSLMRQQIRSLLMPTTSDDLEAFETYNKACDQIAKWSGRGTVFSRDQVAMWTKLREANKWTQPGRARGEARDAAE